MIVPTDIKRAIERLPTAQLRVLLQAARCRAAIRRRKYGEPTPPAAGEMLALLEDEISRRPD